MNARHLTLAAITLLVGPAATAQNLNREAPQDPVQAAIRQFNEKRTKSNEVTVVLDPVGKPTATPNTPAEPAPTPATAPTPAPATTPPAAAESATPAPAGPATPAASLPNDPSAGPQRGLAVRVEKLQTGTGAIDPAQVKLLAPFPAKPLSPAAPGWLLQDSPSAPPFTREVELSPGNLITLTVRPHLLVPDTDGAAVFAVPEPGFDPALGYRQSATVGAILSHSLRQLDDDSKELGGALDKLQQILVSLPKPPPPAEPVADPAAAREPSPATLRKR